MVVRVASYSLRYTRGSCPPRGSTGFGIRSWRGPLWRRLAVACACGFVLGGGEARAASGAGSPAVRPGLWAAAPSVAPLAIDGPWGSTLSLEVYERLRGEFVSWFEPLPGSPTPSYSYDFMGNKLQLGLRARRGPLDIFLQYEDVTLANVPANAVGPGGLYYANTPTRTQHGAVLRNAWASYRVSFAADVALSVRGGRQLYGNGLEVAVRDPELRWLQSQRLAQRLIGAWDYTQAGRSFDGGRIALEHPAFNLTGFGFRPTWGGFEVDANPELDIVVGGAAMSLPDSDHLPGTFAQMSWMFYQDERDVLFIDNRPLAAREASRGRPARLQTLGINAAHVERFSQGLLDAVAYGFGQAGDWQGQDALGWAYGAEAGWRFTELPARPWFRAGINAASGDPDPLDDRHQTFFQMLPTGWIYAQMPFYNMMNNRDIFVQAILDPDPNVSLRFDGHWLGVGSVQDLAYFGSGATRNDLYGYGGVPTRGHRDLALMVDIQATVRVTTWFSIYAFYGHAFGQGVIGANDAGTGNDYGFVETSFLF